MRIAGIILIVIGLGVFGYWGANYEKPPESYTQEAYDKGEIPKAVWTTRYEVPVTTEVEDDFGDVVKSTEFKEHFQFGMMPDKPWDGAASMGGGPLGLGLALIVLSFVMGGKKEEGAA
ncbi:MAG: hypothetical protein VX475_17395 [Myxococcota bacterium]|jgi:hypothetical protein|nr:hypothetical protein [Myxococcota bacterium]